MIQFCAGATFLFLAVLCLSHPTHATPGNISHSPLSVVATTSIIADTARNIAGPLATVTALMGPGIDPHLYKASPGDLRTLSQASLIFYNGLHLEGKMADALQRLGTRKPVVAVTDLIARDKLRAVSTDGTTYDPHVWFDLNLWIECADAIRAALSQHDAPHADEYTKRFQTFREALRQLDTWSRERMSAIPPSNRILITAHDAFGYFGRAYGIEVLAIQGVSTESEASLRSINDLVSVIVERKIPAIFIENTISPKAVEALVEGAKNRGQTVRIGGQLLGDSLGELGTPEESYIGTVRYNVETIATALAPASTRGEP
jgi:manganese/zinc/iron transport system substrate-binding protein